MLAEIKILYFKQGENCEIFFWFSNTQSNTKLIHLSLNDK